MNPMGRLVAAAACAAGAAGAGLGAAAIQTTPLERLHWLAGCWIGESPRRVVEEQWLPPRGNAMVGVGRTTAGDTLVEYELVLVRLVGGRLRYEAHPSGQPSATFVAGEVSDTMVVFENAEHDFPRRVGYRRLGRDSLGAWIDGTVGGRTRRIDFPYRRDRCAGQ